MSDLFQLNEVEVEPTEDGQEASFLLRRMEIYNWGPFANFHREAEIDAGGSAIIGATGSGKTTLVDALMTLLVAFPRYNLASTGGHESDRDLASYVRGIAGAKDSHGENEAVMRPGRTVTGLAATYRAEGRNLQLGAILWFDGASNAAADLKKLWFVVSDEGEDDLSSLLQLFDGGGKRGLKSHGKQAAGVDFYDSKKNYLARLRRLFEVGENAFDLLNRAAGLKQLNSINQIFRDLVLDNKPAFEKALEVAGDFDNLAEIRAEVEEARRQRDSLLPIRKDHARWQKLLATITDLKARQERVPVWFAQRGAGLLEAKLAELRRILAELESREKVLESEENERGEAQKSLQAQYLEAGGNEIESMKLLIASRQDFLAQREKEAGKYRALASALGLDFPTEEAAFLENERQIESRQESGNSEREKMDDDLVALRAAHQLEAERLGDVGQEIKAVERRPNSNIPPRFQDFREALAERLGVDGEALPFVAELVQVRPEEQKWQGAIERALGSERLRVMVPEGRMREALAWVNGRDNRLHVRLLRVEESYHARRFFEDGFCHKLHLKDHVYGDALADLLSRHDRHCVAGAADLERVEHAMTVEGTMSGAGGKFEKQDQRRLGADWMTGFDNATLLARLRAEEKELTAGLAEPLARENEIKKKRAELDRRLGDFRLLQQFDFSGIDVAGARGKMESVQARLRALESPDSDLAKLRTAYEAGEAELKGLQNERRKLTSEIGGSAKEISQSEAKLDELRQRLGAGMAAEEAADLATFFKLENDLPLEKLEQAERELKRRLDERREGLEKEVSGVREKLVRQMEVARNLDTGALAESGTDMGDAGDYLARLQVLEKEDLPKRKARFMEYLNKSSGQGVTQLLTKIENEVTQIKDRIELLNETLGRVDFKSGKFLQLEAAKVGSEVARQLSTARRRLNLATIDPDDTEGEKRFLALKTVVEIVREAALNRRTLSSQALLDPRHRLDFFVHEVDRASGNESGRISGSQTGSGGEKEMMASYILTASLSYALCPRGSRRPRYATIVLDEAFSKSSQSAAARIIKALREFGLHPLFVTPNKEMSLLRTNTRSAILIHRSTITSLTWRELDELHENHLKGQEKS